MAVPPVHMTIFVFLVNKINCCHVIHTLSIPMLLPIHEVRSKLCSWYEKNNNKKQTKQKTNKQNKTKTKNKTKNNSFSGTHHISLCCFKYELLTANDYDIVIYNNLSSAQIGKNIFFCQEYTPP